MGVAHMELAAVEVGITGADGGVGIRAYTQVLTHVRGMLDDIDRLAEPGDISRPEWAVRWAATADGAFRIRLLPRSLPRQRNAASLSVPPVALVEGVRTLGQAAEIPRLFSEAVVGKVAKIAAQIGKSGVTAVQFASINGHRSAEAPVTPVVQANARSAISPASLAWSSVTGVLDVISARSDTLKVGLLTDQGQAVACDVRSIAEETVLRSFNRRVVAAGILHRNSIGQPVRLVAESVEILSREAPAVSARELLGAGRGVIEPSDNEQFMAVLRDR